MPKFLQQYFYGLYRKMILFLGVLFFILLTFFSWGWGLSGFVLFALCVLIIQRQEKKMNRELQHYIASVRHRVKKVGEDVISGLPVGILLYDEQHHIRWHNAFFLQLTKADESQIGNSLATTLAPLEEWLKKDEREGVIRHDDRVLHVIKDQAHRAVYLFDQTEYDRLRVKYEEEQTVFILIHLDNLEEVTQGLAEQRRTLLVSEVTHTISSWAQKLGIYLKRTDADKFFGVMDEQTLKQLEENKFALLDQVRELPSQNKIPVTLSIGVGAGGESFLELGDMVQSSLEIALGRGGDQAAVKRGTGKITFYGGKSAAVEKRTRVRVRVISHALQNIIQTSDQIFMMGHQNPDMDSIGASIGVLKLAQSLEQPAYLVVDDLESSPGIEQLMAQIRQDEELYKHFISPQKALELKTDKSLLVVVDVHKPSLVIEPKLVDHIPKRVIIDHHRRGEEIIPDPLLTYIEPYASSSSELVAELLEYQEGVHISPLEATAMLAGMIVDTKNFAVHTGSRTFQAASFLRLHGADSTFVHRMFKEDKELFVKRARIVAEAEIYRDVFAISVAPADETYSSILLAQAADTLLTLKNVQASFVLCQREAGQLTINARSWGEVNVQMLMEKMHGGGHLTHAATQLAEINVDEAVQWLKEVIDETLEGGSER